MLEIKKIALENIVTYKEEEFEFKPGISLVKGENRAGKSLLFSSIANLLYFSHPLSDKKDVKSLFSSNLDLEKPVKSRISLLVKDRDTEYEISQKSSGQSVNYEIKKNSENLDCKTITSSKEIIESVFKQPEDIFYTSTYLTSYRNHPLLHGSYSQRYEFFEKLFNFEILDFFEENINSELKLLEKKAIELETLKSQLVNLSTKEEELNSLQAELSKIQLRRQSLQENLDKESIRKVDIEKLLDAVSRFEEVELSLSQFKEVNPFLSSFSDLEISNSLIEKEGLYTDHLKYEKTQEILKSQRNQLNKFESDLSLLTEEKDVLSIEKDLLDLRSRKDGLQKTLLELNNVSQGKDKSYWETLQKRTLEIELKAQGFKKEFENPEESIQESKEKLAVLAFKKKDISEKLKRLSTLDCSHGELTCFTCQSSLTAGSILSLKEQLEMELSRISEEQPYLEEWLAVGDKFLKSRAFLKNIGSFEEVLKVCDTITLKNKELQTVLTNIAEQDSKLKQYLVYNQSRKSLLENAELKKQEILATEQELPSIKTTETSGEIRKSIDLLKQLQNLLNQQKKEEQKVLFLKEKSLLEGSKDQLTALLRTTQQELTILVSENNVIQNSFTNNQIQKGILEKEVAVLKSYQGRVNQLQLELQDRPLLERLTSVFSSKGFRLEKITFFIRLFQETLNKYSKFLFMEPFQFDIKIEKRDLLIQAIRNGKVSDVRFLSGSESRCFQLLSLISILSLIPTSKKSNIVILDEMDAGLDHESSRMFYESFLPELKQIVPSVIVITPLKDQGFYFTPEYNYYIKKENGVSRVT